MSKTRATLRGAILTAILLAGFSAQASLTTNTADTASANRPEHQNIDLLAKKGADDR